MGSYVWILTTLTISLWFIHRNDTQKYTRRPNPNTLLQVPSTSWLFLTSHLSAPPATYSSEHNKNTLLSLKDANDHLHILSSSQKPGLCRKTSDLIYRLCKVTRMAAQGHDNCVQKHTIRKYRLRWNKIQSLVSETYIISRR